LEFSGRGFLVLRGGETMAYIDDHPTTFNWLPGVKTVVRRLQRAHPWRTWIGTYIWHPPYNPSAGILRDYQWQSFDVWGGGIVNGVYQGERGKPLPKRLGNKIFKELWRGEHGGPLITWIIWDGRMWVRGEGWQPTPSGPPDSDPGHYKHIHVTFMPF
jgi:hypothetical protein